MIRFATIGTSQIVCQFLEAAKDCNDACHEAVYSRTMNRALEFQKQWGVKKSYDDLQKLAEDPDIDAVYIASPNSCHYQQAKLMMEHGKHVLCEKPCTSNEQELQELLCLAEEKQVVFLEAMRMMFDEGMDVIKAHLEELGIIRKASFSYCQYSSRYDAFQRGEILNAFRPELSNGALMDIGSYPIHAMAGLFGMPDQISSMGFRLHNGVDGMGSALFLYEERGMIGEISYSKISDSHTWSQIQGEKASLLIDHIQNPTKILMTDRKGTRVLYDLDDQIKQEQGKGGTVGKPQYRNNMIYELEAFCQMIKRERRAEEYNRISLIKAKILDQIRAEQGIVFPADQREEFYDTNLEAKRADSYL